MITKIFVRLFATYIASLYLANACSEWRSISDHTQSISASDCGLVLMVRRTISYCISEPSIYSTTRQVRHSSLNCTLNNEIGECVGECVSKTINVSLQCSSTSRTHNCSFIYASKNCDNPSWGRWSGYESCYGSATKVIAKRLCTDCDGRRIKSLYCNGEAAKQKSCVASWGDWEPWGSCKPNLENTKTSIRYRKRRCFYDNGNEHNGTNLCSENQSSNVEQESCNTTNGSEIMVYDFIPTIKSSNPIENEQKKQELNNNEKTTTKINAKNSIENKFDLVMMLCVLIPIVVLIFALILFVLFLLKGKKFKKFSFFLRKDFSRSSGRKTMLGPVNGDVYAVVVKT